VTPRRALALALLAVAALLLLSGFGITHHTVVGPLTLGLLDKPTAQLLHTLLWGPFAVLLLLHCGRSR
jgi:hypothetical protein